MIRNFKVIHFLAVVSVLIIFAQTTCSIDKTKQIPQIDFETFEPLLHQQNDTVYVINFWATWCKPCVKELPDFEKIKAEYKDHKVRVILVSLDFPNKYEELLIPFVENKALQCEVIHLKDVDANKWIDKVSPDWSGAIPATVIYKGNEREFFEAQMNYEKLKSIIETKL